jgi:hypothetical protein
MRILSSANVVEIAERCARKIVDTYSARRPCAKTTLGLVCWTSFASTHWLFRQIHAEAMLSSKWRICQKRSLPAINAGSGYCFTESKMKNVGRRCYVGGASHH